MEKEFSAHIRQDGRYTIIPEEPGRRDEDYCTGRFSSNVQYSVNGDPLKKGCDKKLRELICAI